MSKEIKDYLHLYLGCVCVVSNRPAILNTVSTHPKMDTAVVRFTDTDDETDWAVLNDLSEIIPLLRPLNSITEEEILEVCKVACPKIFGAYRFKKWKVEKIIPWDDFSKNYEVTNEKSDYSFSVDLMDGDICLYDEKDFEPTMIDQNYRFWYLKNYFDIFGLIEARIAGRLTTPGAQSLSDTADQ